MKSLADLLSIPPLSRVQLNSRAIIREATLFTRGPGEPPFWFFQCVIEDMLELRSPGGFMVRVAPTDVCDIVTAEPLIVQAMPKEVFIDRLKLPLRDRSCVPTPECYSPAQVMWVTKDKWHRVDSVFVRFLEDRHNEGISTWSAPVTVASRDLLNQVARRDRLPVADLSSKASWSALNRERPEQREARKAIDAFFCAALTRCIPRRAGLPNAHA